MPATRSDGTGLPRWRATGPTLLALAALLAAVVLVPPTPAAATTCLDGTGTSLDPFLVRNATDLGKVGSGTGGCDSDSFYLQTADITLTGNWTPIINFSGTYDGGDRTISGLMVSVGTSGGLFASTRTGALIRRTHLVDASVTGGSNTGGLVGSATATRIEDSSFSGSVTSTGNSIGGLVGIAFDDLKTAQPTTILRSSSAGTVTSQGNNVGGLVGYLADGGLRASWSTADVAGSGDLHGGLVGYLTGRSTAGPVQFSGTATATTSQGTSVVAGDVFRWYLLLDVTSDSTGSEGDYSTKFNDAVDAFSLSADAANAGTWDPDAITWAIAPVNNLDANANGDSLTLQVKATSDAPRLDGKIFDDVVISLDWDATDLDATWQAGTVTLADWLQSDRPPAPGFTSFELRNADGASATFSDVLEADLAQTGDLIDASARGDVTVSTPEFHVGGAVGRLASNTRGARVLATGTVSADTSSSVGGLAGDDASDSVVDSFWDTETSGQASSDAGTGKTTAQMTSISTFNDTATEGLTTAWPIVAGWQPYVAGTTVWGICERVNDGYPFLLWRYDSDPCTDPVAAPSLAVTCPTDADGTLPVGTPITCTLTGGDPGIDILWRAALNPTFAEGVVRTGTDGTGTIPLTIPPAAAGSPITVELVAWTAPLPVGTAAGTAAGGPVPSAIPAGDGASAPPWVLLLAVLAGLALAATAAPSIGRAHSR